MLTWTVLCADTRRLVHTCLLCINSCLTFSWDAFGHRLRRSVMIVLKVNVTGPRRGRRCLSFCVPSVVQTPALITVNSCWKSLLKFKYECSPDFEHTIARVMYVLTNVYLLWLHVLHFGFVRKSELLRTSFRLSVQSDRSTVPCNRLHFSFRIVYGSLFTQSTSLETVG